MKNILLLTASLFAIETFSQTQKGLDIDGEVGGGSSGWSASMPDGNTVGIGDVSNDGNGSNAGHVRIYKWTGISWIQKGGDIDGEAPDDRSGYATSMPDSNTVAIGAYQNDGNGSDAGQVRVYSWNGSNWIQKGGDIDGEAAGDESGTSVSMPDSNTVAIGAPLSDALGFSTGHVRIYSWNGSNWIQKGNDIDGEQSGSESGISVSMPDSNTVAIGAHKNNGNGSNSGHVRVYKWNGSSWIQKGVDIDGEAAGDGSGWSVIMPDSNTIAIGSRLNDDNGSYAGHVRVYSWNGSNWIQKGNDLDGEAADDYSGFSISMPDSNHVAIGAPNNDGNGNDAGHARIYRWNGSNWIQKGVDIDGEASIDRSGWSVCMPDTSTVGIGAPNNNASGSNAGHFRVYNFCGLAGSLQSLTVCDSLVSPSGNYTWTTSGTYLDTVLNALGCDSVITFNLTIGASSSSFTQTHCDSLESPSGNYTWTTSGIYTDTIPNALGCDSVMTFNLIINNSTSANITQTACNSLVSPSGNYTWITSGTYMDTIPNAAGCDSVVTFNLTINNSTIANIAQTACDSLVSPSGNYTWTTSGTHFDTIPNTVGCDSVMTFNLTINNSTSANIIQIACDSMVSPSGNYTWTASGTYLDTIPNASGCDSVITIALTINGVSDISTTISGTSITANNAGANYQWLNCDDNYSIIGGETAQSFTPAANGNYSVELTESGCVDTSECVAMTTIGIIENSFGNNLIVFPNPTSGNFTIDLGNTHQKTEVIITNVSGAIIDSKTVFQSRMLDLSLEEPAGMYIISIEAGDKTAVIRLVKE